MSISIVKTQLDIQALDNIPVKLDLSGLWLRFRFHKFQDQGFVGKVSRDFVDRIVSIAKPEAVFKLSQIAVKPGGFLSLDNKDITNSLLKVNLNKAEKVFAYALTCGRDFDLCQDHLDDEDYRYCLKVIQEFVLDSVFGYVQDYLLKHYQLDYLWSIDPGELQAWPVSGRKQLFSLLGGLKRTIGLHLLDDYSLQPRLSRLGILYYAPAEFESCQVCSQNPCMMRRAPFNPLLAQKYSDRAKKPCGSRG